MTLKLNQFFFSPTTFTHAHSSFPPTILTYGNLTFISPVLCVSDSYINQLIPPSISNPPVIVSLPDWIIPPPTQPRQTLWQAFRGFSFGWKVGTSDFPIMPCVAFDLNFSSLWIRKRNLTRLFFLFIYIFIYLFIFLVVWNSKTAYTLVILGDIITSGFEYCFLNTGIKMEWAKILERR